MARDDLERLALLALRDAASEGKGNLFALARKYPDLNAELCTRGTSINNAMNALDKCYSWSDALLNRKGE